MELRPHEIEAIRLQRDIDAMIERDKRIYAERTLEPVRKIKSKPVKLKWPRRNAPDQRPGAKT